MITWECKGIAKTPAKAGLLAIPFSLWLKLSDDIMGLKQHIGGCTRQWFPWILHRQIVDKEFL